MQPTKHKHSARSFADYAFGASRLDALQMPEPRISGSVCGVLNSVLYSPEGDGGGGGGGDERKFTQADVDRFVQDRLKKVNAELEGLKSQSAEFADIKKKLGEAERERQEALEAKALEGKNDLEKLQHQLAGATKKLETANAEWARRLEEQSGATKKIQDSHRSYVQRHLVGTALSDVGIAKGANKDATLAFLSDAQFDIDEESGDLKAVTVGGKTFEKEKLADAAKHFLSDRPYYAPPAGGGSGGPRSALGGAAGGSVDSIQTLTGLLSTGMQQHAAKSGA